MNPFRAKEVHSTNGDVMMLQRNQKPLAPQKSTQMHIIQTSYAKTFYIWLI